MKWQTHLSFGLLLGLIIFDSWIYILLAGVFSLLPDIDKFGSKISKKTFPFSLVFNILPHRKITHSWIMMFIGLVFILNINLMIAYLIGVGSHMLLDSLTKSGIRPLWPFKAKVNFIFKTNSFFDNILLFVFVLGDLLLMLK